MAVALFHHMQKSRCARLSDLDAAPMTLNVDAVSWFMTLSVKRSALLGGGAPFPRSNDGKWKMEKFRDFNICWHGDDCPESRLSLHMTVVNLTTPPFDIGFLCHYVKLSGTIHHRISATPRSRFSIIGTS